MTSKWWFSCLHRNLHSPWNDRSKACSKDRAASKIWGGGGVYKKLKEVDWEVPWRLFGHDVYKSLGPLLQHHNSPGCGFPEPWKWASPQPSDHWHHYPPEASCVLEKHSSCYKNSIQMDSRSQWHLEIGGRRAGLLTENQECAICP